MDRRFWTAREDEILRTRYADAKTEFLAFWLGRGIGTVYQRAAALGLKKSAEYMAGSIAYFLRRHPEAGAGTRFKPGHTSWNKGLRRPGWAPGRMAETQFKKGQINGNAARIWVPVGSRRYSKDGYLEVKAREREGRHGNFVGAHVLVWRYRQDLDSVLAFIVAGEPRKPGRLVPKGWKVAFRDGDKSHIALDNLELVPAAEMMRRNSVHNLPKELADVIQLAGALKRRLRRLSV